VQAVQESLGGIRDILIDQSQPVYLRHFERIGSRLRRAQVVGSFISASPRYVVEAVGMVLIALLALMLSSRSGSFASALPVLGALALSAQRLLPLLQQVYYGWAQARTGSPVANDIASLLDLELKPERIAAGVVPPLPFRREIRLDKLSFAYPDRSEHALHDVDLAIPRGTKLALIGKTGSGKSTLVDILMGLLEPTSGSITVDGVAPTGKAMLAWQAQIAHVPQAIFLADTTIERNIAFAAAEGQVDHDRVRVAAKLAQVHDFIEALPEGYETFVGERGIRLSGGQRQRLGIARALYKRASVLILDEATSALDRETEAAVMAGLAEADEAVTIVMIAHRLSTVASCDTIVRLDGGRIVETGSYADVIGHRTQREMDRNSADALW
jgi:ABC-type multidrug transport system fused ATPase/permease subunit